MEESWGEEVYLVMVGMASLEMEEVVVLVCRWELVVVMVGMASLEMEEVVVLVCR